MKLIPAEVESWDGVTLRVHIPGYTDGAEIGMRAEILHAISDRPAFTGYKILAGDPVWVIFNNDDPNQPIVFGFRSKNTGEHKDRRAFEHKDFEVHAERNIEMNAQNQTFNANNVVINATQITLKGTVNIEGTLSTTGQISTDAGVSALGEVSGNGVNLSEHIHTGVESGNKKTGKPEK